MPMSDQIRVKLDQIAENLSLVLTEYPDRIALDRIKFALALTQFVRTQAAIDATDATVPIVVPRVAAIKRE